MTKPDRFPASWIAVPLALSLLAAGLAHLVLLRHMPLVGDALDYHLQATALLRGEFADRAFYYPPGMTFLLSLVYTMAGENLLAVRLCILGLSVLTVLFVCLLTFELSGSKRLGRTAGILAAVYPPAILLSAQPYSNVLASVCVTAIAWLWLRGTRRPSPWALGAAGMLLGVGCLTRPSMVSLGIVMAVTWAVALRRCRSGRHPAPPPPANSPPDTGRSLSRWPLARGGLLAALGFLLAVVPVLHHNAAVGAGWTLSTNNEGNFFKGNNPYTPLYKTSLFTQRRVDSLGLAPEAWRYITQYRGLPDRRQLEMRAALRHIAAKPHIFLLRTLNRCRAFWGFDYLATRQVQKWAHLGTGSALGLLLLEGGGYVAIVALALAGLLGGPGQGSRGPVWSTLGFVLAYQLPYAVSFAAGTYHFPVMGLLLPFAAFGFAGLAARWRQSWRRLFDWPWPVWLAWGILAAIQVEYAYFTWKWVE